MSNLENWRRESIRKLSEFGAEIGAIVVTDLASLDALQLERKRNSRVCSIHFMDNTSTLAENRYAIAMPGVLQKLEKKIRTDEKAELARFVQEKWYRRLLFKIIRYKL